MACFAIRGAIDVPRNEPEKILDASRALLQRMVEANAVAVSDIVSVIFSVTADLDTAPPAQAARQMGWTWTPLFCVQEMSVPDAIPRCIRVLMHVNGARNLEEVRHVYLAGARALRPDLAEGVVRS